MYKELRDRLNTNRMKVNFGHHVVLTMQKEQAFWWPWVTVPHIAPPTPDRFKEALEAMVGKCWFSLSRVFPLKVHLVEIKKRVVKCKTVLQKNRTLWEQDKCAIT